MPRPSRWPEVVAAAGKVFREKGYSAATLEEIAAEVDALVQRDAKDATQTVQAKDAVVLDTTYLTQVEQVERIVALAHAVSHRPDAT